MKIKPETNRIRCILLGIILWNGVLLSFGQVNSGATISAPSKLLDGKTPVANWIWDSGEDNPKNYYLMVRKTIELKQVPSEAKAFISAYSYADVYINGKLVERCPTNCDPEYQVYEQYDLSGYFQKGENTISALVYNFGLGMSHRINARGGFFFQGKLTFDKNNIQLITSDQSWKVAKAEAWDNATELRTGNAERRPNLIGFIEKYDARKMPENWKAPEFDDSKWQAAKKLGIPPFAPWNSIVEINRPPLFRERVYPVKHWFAGDKIVYDFGKEITGTPVIELFSKYDGARFEMGTSERVLPDSTILYKKRVDYTDCYLSKKGLQTWSPLTWRGFRYLCLSASDSLIFKSVSSVSQHYNYTDEGSFECSDPLLNKIYETGIFTLKLCAQDTYMDTPWREQTQYIAGDSRYLQKYAYYPFGLSSEYLMHYNILSGIWSQRWKDDGSIRSRYPTDWLLGENTSAYLVDYELEYVIMLDEYYQYFGNANLLRQIYPNLKKLMGYLESLVGKEHGLLSKVPGWIVLDHPDTYPMDQKGEITGLNCLYYGALNQAALVAGTINGDQQQADVWTKKAEELKVNIKKWLWSPEKELYLDSYGSKKCSQQTQVYAMLYGLVDPAEKANLVEKVAADNRSSEQSFAYYVLYSMFDAKPQWSLDYIRKYWGEQMKLPLFNGGWHEAWDIANWPREIATSSHAWCSGPTALLPQKVLGAEPVSAGWKTFSVKPNPCDLKWAKGIVPTAYGAISIDWKIDDNGTFSLYVLVPEKTTAEIAVPAADPLKVSVNGKPNNKFRNENGKVIFQALPGEYEIKSIK
ncbi:MAG: glycoside hydrolase family 78 protein [Prolixibacteraceae bacterium]|nr:glycoside hydrolase family 78 protein [Prolixibacteraceae bacterium]